SLREQAEGFVLETDLDPISAKGALVLPEQTALGILHNVEKIISIEVLTHHAYWQAPDEFRLEPVFDKILRGDVLKQFVVHHLNRLGAEPDLAVADTSCHVLVPRLKRASN